MISSSSNFDTVHLVITWKCIMFMWLLFTGKSNVLKRDTINYEASIIHQGQIH